MTSEIERHCASCDISEEDTVLFDISLPPFIKRQDLCRKCLNIFLDRERKRKAS